MQDKQQQMVKQLETTTIKLWNPKSKQTNFKCLNRRKLNPKPPA